MVKQIFYLLLSVHIFQFYNVFGGENAIDFWVFGIPDFDIIDYLRILLVLFKQYPILYRLFSSEEFLNHFLNDLKLKRNPTS